MEEVIKVAEKEFSAVVAIFKQDISGIRTNRPTSKLVEDIKVDYMDQQFPIKQLGAINIVPPREIQINVWDKGALAAIVKAIEASGIGMTPNIDGNTIRLFLPTITDERRKELEKLIRETAEKHRIRIRSVRDDANKKVEAGFKAKLVTEDQRFRFKKQVQEAVDKVNKEIDRLLEDKLREINA